MKRFDRIGGVFLIAGALLFGLIHLAIAMYIPGRGTTISSERLFQTLYEMHGFVPYILSLIFMLLGVYFIFFMNEEKTDDTIQEQV
ncbi:hypothetical protein AJ85_05620 [Alkalihalobacillus alcalophilus ATCC 27647 = CGMCC 1.3604]|uniref:Uncharacterized protein n=1 Tax=Alkalihalobacillus alcalophilus ATCC 27647 = CGMCC 1.3604 TaxID=1218173 RepID=A0A4V3X803_ALKAL|nr:hypothetical protein [Alkalihalobacillus alcalophilus]MED1562311.1 hypothetical protein [Alkalihalobacillus alcalophilus]THG88382.1 hypothetical protein AJ85_05620 [Alkalihalobacillus alcalophilus ATCC 27647 = CGMCC 1.3604]